MLKLTSLTITGTLTFTFLSHTSARAPFSIASLIKSWASLFIPLRHINKSPFFTCLEFNCTPLITTSIPQLNKVFKFFILSPTKIITYWIII